MAVSKFFGLLFVSIGLCFRIDCANSQQQEVPQVSVEKDVNLLNWMASTRIAKLFVHADNPISVAVKVVIEGYRDELRTEFVSNKKDGDLHGAIQDLELKLACDSILSDQAEQLITLDWIVELTTDDDDFERSLSAQSESLKIAILRGESNYRIVDRKLGIEHTKLLSRLTSEQREQLQVATELDLLSESQDEEIDSVIKTLERAIEIKSSVLGQLSGGVSKSQYHLAQVLMASGKFDQAKQVSESALRIRDVIFGNDHPDVGSSCHQLADIHIALGDFGHGEHYLNRASKVFSDLARTDPIFSVPFILLSRSYSKIGSHKGVVAALESSLSYKKYFEDMSFGETSELKNLASTRFLLDDFIDYANRSRKVESASVASSVLSWKGAITRRQRAIRRLITQPSISQLLAKLDVVTQQLARFGPSLNAKSSMQSQVAKWTAEKQILEATLMQQCKPLLNNKTPLTLEAIQQTIPKNGVLIDYLEYNSTDGLQLMAILVWRDTEPKMVSLGSVGELRSNIDVWRESFGEEPESLAAGVRLRQQVWGPLLEHIGASQTILVSTDGDLGRISLGALPGRELGSYLIEDHRLVLVPVPSQLPELMHVDESVPSTRELLAIGDIDYDAASVSVDFQPDKQLASQSNSDPIKMYRLLGKSPPNREADDQIRGDVEWTSLNGTGPEVNYIHDLFDKHRPSGRRSVVRLEQDAASETAFRKLAPGSRFIHVATHGFFASPKKKSALSRDMVANIANAPGFSPGQLSGLVFAGANRKREPLTPNPSPRSGVRGDDSDDGILTADEIAYMQLEACELVVLSACETNLGAVAGGEGILGLQRGFLIAGARSVVASQWKVDDDATKTLMQLFYTNLWEKKMSKLDSLREAQLTMLNHYNPDNNRLDRAQPVEMKLVPKKEPKSSGSTDRSKRLSPKYWAAFQLSGDWR